MVGAARPFSAIDALITDGVFGLLSDASVSINGGRAFSAMFDDEYQSASIGAVGMASSQPAVTVPAERVPASPIGLPITVDGNAYEIAAMHPDGSMVTLLLEAIA